jgi:ribosomal protein L13E
MHHVKPTVTAQKGKERKGRGFSPDELKEAGITATEAKKISMPVDWKRKTSHVENVENLKAHAEKAQTPKKPKAPKKKEKKV